MVGFFELILIGVTVLVAFTLWWYLSGPSNLPPGPLGLPLFGSSFKTWRSSTLCDQLCQWAKKYGPVYKLYVGNKMVVVLGDWNTIQEGLVKQGDTYAGRPHFNTIFPEEIVGVGLTNSEGELWKIQRHFALSTLRSFGFGRPILEPLIHDEAQYLFDVIDKKEGKPFDLAPVVYNAVSNIICAVIFGKRFQHGDEKFGKLLWALRSRLTETDTSILTPFVFSKQISRLMAHTPQIKRLRALTEEMINFIKLQTFEVLKSFRSDSIGEPSNYIEAFYKEQQLNKEGGWTFTDPQLIASVANIFTAGTDGTSTTLRWAIFLMAHFPELQEKVYEEIRREIGAQSLPSYADRCKLPLTEATIMETHRYASLVPFGVMRRTLAPSKVCGYDIPSGTTVVSLVAAVHRDEKLYPDPEKFDPNRFLIDDVDKKRELFSHIIPFQIGKRICIGESLAKMELFIVFTSLISKYRFFFSPDEPKPALQSQVSLIIAPIPHKICAQRRVD